jgi:hypothetical protein
MSWLAAKPSSCCPMQVTFYKEEITSCPAICFAGCSISSYISLYVAMTSIQKKFLPIFPF